MLKIKVIFYAVLFGLSLPHAMAVGNELAKIQNQIKQTEQQNKQIEQKIKTSLRDIEQTKKQLVRTADRVNNLEEQRGALTKRIAELDVQRNKLNTELSQSHDGISDAMASILFIASHPNFDS